MSRRSAGILLSLALCVGVARADRPPYLAFAGHSAEFEDDALGYTLLSHGFYDGRIALFRGASLPWHLSLDHSKIRTAMGVVAMPDGRRCIFESDGTGLYRTCEVDPLRENWGFRLRLPFPSTSGAFAIAAVSPFSAAAAAGCIDKVIVGVSNIGADLGTFWVRAGITPVATRADTMQGLPLPPNYPHDFVDGIVPVPIGRCGSIGTSTRTDAVLRAGNGIFYYESASHTLNEIRTPPHGLASAVQVNSSASANTGGHAIRMRIHSGSAVYATALTPANRLDPPWTRVGDALNP